MNIQIIILAGLMVFIPSNRPEIATTSPQVVEVVEVIELSVEEQLKEYFGDNHPLISIAFCESGFRQFHNGEVLKGYVNNKDIGVFQINEYYHLKDSIRLGYDIYTLEGNMKFAEHLYKTQGVQPWIWSNPCHNLISKR